MNRVAIVGVGLIGSSFALALRKAGFDGELVGVSSPRSIASGIEAGAITHGVTLTEAAEWADLIYLSQPIDQILKTIEVLGPIVHAECLITDAGSTKAAIVDAALEHIRSATFLGGHPMAGKEQRGAEAADADLFRERPYVVTSSATNDRTEEFLGWLHRIGAKVIEMTPALHDQTVALTSHLPQLLSTALSATLAEQNNGYIPAVFGPGLLDMTRLSLSAPEVWMSVLETNKSAVDEALTHFRHTLANLQDRLKAGDLADLFTSAAVFAQTIRKPPSTE